MTIVCATRFSEESTHAVKGAAALARKGREQLHLVHVIQPSVVQGLSDRLVETIRSALESEVGRLRAVGTVATAEILVGRVDEELAKYCGAKGARMLVVGDTARRSGDLLAGTLDRLAYAVESPLLIIRDERPFERWATDGGELRVMLAFDRTASSAIARDWLARLAQFGEIDLSVLHLYWVRDEYERHGKKVPPGDEGHAWLVQTMKQEIETELGHLPPNVKVNLHTEMASGRIDTHLIDLASATQVDLMLLGTHRRRALGRLWSVSHHVMLQAPMAVACVPATTPVPHIAGAPAWNSALCLADFSESSSRVAAWAATLLRSGGTLHLAHVTAEMVSDERKALLLDKLRETLPPSIESNALKVQVHVLHGLPEKSITQAVDRLGVDLICIGSKAATGFDKAQSGILAPALVDQWRLVQSLLETTGKPVFIAPALRA